jgi:hypothetical protein
MEREIEKFVLILTEPGRLTACQHSWAHRWGFRQIEITFMWIIHLSQILAEAAAQFMRDPVIYKECIQTLLRLVSLHVIEGTWEWEVWDNTGFLKFYRCG